MSLQEQRVKFEPKNLRKKRKRGKTALLVENNLNSKCFLFKVTQKILSTFLKLYKMLINHNYDV